MAPLSLAQLLGTALVDDDGVIRVGALHRLLQAVLELLGMQDLPAPEQGHGPTPLLAAGQPAKAHPGRDKEGDGAEGTGQQPQQPEERVSGQDPLQEPQSGPQAASVAVEVEGLKKQVEVYGRDISKAMAVSQDTLEEVGRMKVVHSRMAEELRAIQEALGLGAGGQSVPAKPPMLDTDSQHGASSAPGLKGPGTQPATLGMQPGSPSVESSVPGEQPAAPGTQGAGGHPSPPDTEPGLPGAQRVPAEATAGSLGTQRAPMSAQEGGALPGTQLAQAEHPAAETLTPAAQGFETPLDAGPRVGSPLQEAPESCGSLDSSSASILHAEMVEACREMGQLSQLCAALREQVAQLEANKLEKTELEKLRLEFQVQDRESTSKVLSSLLGQVSSLARDLREEKEKVRQLEDALGKLRAAGADRSVLQEMRWELGEQQEVTKATSEQAMTKMAEQLQQQLDELWAMVQHAGQGQEEVQVQAVCAVCSGAQVGQLLRCYEKLQEQVDFLASQRAVVRQLPRMSQQDKELLRSVQARIIQAEELYGELSSVTRSLQEQCQERQREMEALFQSLERLEKEKEDKEDAVLLSQVKSSLAGKVSRPEFEANMERLKETIGEVQSWMSGQEWEWDQLQQQLQEQQVDSKLDSLELGPFQQELEKWRKLLEELKEKLPVTGAEDAAGLKQQLLPHFHCISCDQPLCVPTPGPPALPPMPAPSSISLQRRKQLGYREQAAECRYPKVPRQCGGRHTVTHPLQRPPHLQPRPPSTARPLHTTRWLRIEDAETELLDPTQTETESAWWDGQLPPLEAKEGPTTSPEHWPASAPHHLSQAPRFLLPLQTPWDRSSSPAQAPSPRPPSSGASSGQQR